jgi:hypothetical protein
MVHIVEYGSLPEPRSLPASARRQAYGRFLAVAAAALATVAVVASVHSSGATRTSLEMREYATDPNPADLNDDQVKGIWANTDQAWDGIDTVLPTSGGAWESQDDPTVGYAFHNPGSTTAENGWAGYYDTALTNGEPVIGSSQGDDVNAAMGYDPTLAGTNSFWGDRGGQNAEDPAVWGHNAPLTVNQMSDGDYVPDSWVQGGPSHSALNEEMGGGDGSATGSVSYEYIYQKS